MRKSSVGAAIWIMWWTGDVGKVMTIADLVKRYYAEGSTKNVNSKIRGKSVNPVRMLKTLLNAGVPLYYVVQTPGDIVVSPASTRGAAHMVFSYGDLTQVAWNHSFTVDAWRSCLGMYKGINEERNSGAATRRVIPCLRIQHHLGLDLGLKEDIYAQLATIHVAEENGLIANVVRIDSPPVHCGYLGKNGYVLPRSCGHAIDLTHFAVFCYECFVKYHLSDMTRRTLSRANAY